MIDYEAEKKTIEKLIADVFVAEANGDMEGTMAIYADDIVFQGANAPQLVGIDSVRKYYEQYLPSYATLKGKSVTQEISVSGDMAYDIGVSELTVDSPDGSSKVTGKYTCVWKKIDSEWKNVVIAFSLDTPV